ncbi:MAG TPA: hypothetical protein VFG45_00560 [Candidatus Nitrosocosmicus sp.]|nr:hypothetical protein [Candidatus Nitrosocosmicus sp.]
MDAFTFSVIRKHYLSSIYIFKDIKLDAVLILRKKMKNVKKLTMNLGVIFIFGMVLTAATNVYVSAQAQLNTTTNQSNPSPNNINVSKSPKDEASVSIKGAIIETGEFLGNVTQKIAKSKSASSVLNETSGILGDAYVETKKFFSPN